MYRPLTKRIAGVSLTERLFYNARTNAAALSATVCKFSISMAFGRGAIYPGPAQLDGVE